MIMSGKGKKHQISVKKETGTKRARKSINLEQKLDVIRRYERNEKTCDIVRATGLQESTLRNIRKTAEKIKSSCASATPLSATRTSKTRPEIMETMEKLLSTWIQNQTKRKSFADLKAIKEKARNIYDSIKNNYPPEEVKEFNASSGWFHRFKQRHSFHNLKLSGEGGNADEIAAYKFPEEFMDIVEEGGYSLKQIFNFDETGLFWKRMPSRTYIAKEEAISAGFKVSKDRITVLLGGNANGDCKLKPLVVYHSENPKAFRGISKYHLPVLWRSSKKGWITSDIVLQYFSEPLHRELEAYCKKENIDFKILLVIDKYPGHPRALMDISENIKVVFFPSNTTSLLQPMDQGVIAAFKAYYLRRTFSKIIKVTDGEKQSVKNFWKHFNIKDAIYIMIEAWRDVPASCMHGVWQKLLPHLVNEFISYELPVELAKLKVQCVTLAKQAGFNEVEEKDVNELLECCDSDDMSTDELKQLHKELGFIRTCDSDDERDNDDETTIRELTRDVLQNSLAKIEEGLQELENNDCNTERSEKVSRMVKQDLACYYQLLREKSKSDKQVQLGDLLKKSRPTDPPNTHIDILPSTSKDINAKRNIDNFSRSGQFRSQSPASSTSSMDYDDSPTVKSLHPYILGHNDSSRSSTPPFSNSSNSWIS